MEEIIKNQIQGMVITEAQKKVLIDAKKKVEAVIGFIQDLEKINGANKQSKNAIKTMKAFLKCNITNPAIYKKYQEVMVLMERYANGIKN